MSICDRFCKDVDCEKEKQEKLCGQYLFLRQTFKSQCQFDDWSCWDNGPHVVWIKLHEGECKRTAI